MELKRYRKRAIKKGVEYDLDRTWLKEKLRNGKCEATGIPFKYRPKLPTINPYLPSVDRIDSSKGYTKDNCQLVILGYNNLKSDNSIDDVTKFCRGFVKYYEENYE